MALAQGRRGRGIEESAMLVEPIQASHLVDLSQDLDCGELVKLAGEPQTSDPLGRHLSVADSQYLGETPSECETQLEFDDGAA